MLLYNKFVDSTGNKINSYLALANKQYITTYQLTQYARNYYNCSNLPGMLLEGVPIEGTGGNHWDRSSIYNELMTGSTIYENRIMTNFTLKFLADTGWYSVDFSKANKTIWGKNKGCDFLVPICSKFSEFCTVNNSLSCNYQYTHLSSCFNDGLANCNYYYGFQSCSSDITSDSNSKAVVDDLKQKFPYQDFGPGSKCVLSQYNNLKVYPTCRKVQCIANNIIITINDSLNITCLKNETNAEKIININNITTETLLCPNYDRMCFMEDDTIDYVSDILYSDYVKYNLFNIIFNVLLFLNIVN